MSYMAVLIAPDGAFVTDYHGTSTIEEVEQKLADQGSRWYFYPFHAVVTDTYIGKRKRLASVAYPFEEFKGRYLRTLTRHVASLPVETLEAILNE